MRHEKYLETYTSWMLGWPKSPFRFFFHKIKNTFFIFANKFIDLDILGMSAIPCYWLLVGRGQRKMLIIFQCIRQPMAKNYLAKISIVPRNFANHFWHIQSITASSPYTVQIFYFFLHCSCIFTFLEIIKHTMRKILHIFFCLQY